MALADIRLAVLTFAQRWDAPGTTLHANVVLVPSVDPVGIPLAGSAPAFADRVPTFKAVVIPSLDATPATGDPLAERLDVQVLVPAAPVAPHPAYDTLAAQATAQGVTIATNGPLGPAPTSVIRKALPQSYLDATGARPNGATTTTVDDFGCAIRGTPPEPISSKPPTTIRWGELISYALRQPVLATKLGLRYELAIALPSAAQYAQGGWLFIELATGDPWKAAATPGQIRLYASRIPPLTTARQLFAGVLFPVDASGTSADDLAVVEAETYDDGFAKIVHVNQPSANDAVVGDGSLLPAATDAGIQVGWDDEQVVTWQNRQIDLLRARAGGTLDAQTPVGVAGYRVDVADVTGLSGPPPLAAWHSLVTAKRTLPAGFGEFDGELTIEPVPLRPHNTTADAWLPHYFAMWRGGSLLVPDPVPKALVDGKAIAPAPDPVGVLLSYGKTYAFRVRLADLSGGGAAPADDVLNAGPAAAASIPFVRRVPPKSPRIEPRIPAGAKLPDRYTFFRPLIGYPEAAFTRLGGTDADRGAIVTFFTSNAKPGTGKVVGLPDPDVETFVITVEVRAPLHDVAGNGELDPPYRVLYRTTRAAPALPSGPTPDDPGLALDVAYVDAASIDNWAPVQPPTGPLLVPRARDVRITVHAVLRSDPSAIDPAAANGLVARTVVRAESRIEPPVLVSPVDGQPPLRGFAFRRPPDVAAPPVAAQLAQQLDVVADGLTLSAPPGRRIVFGASKAVRHTLSGDRSTLTFAAESELLRQWLIALVCDLERDWTWDDLAGGTIAVARDAVTVGTAQIPNVVGPDATADPAHADRTRTRVIFFDAIDPHEATASGFPEALTHVWRLDAQRVVETDPPVGVAGTPALTGPDPAPGTELAGVEQKLTLPIQLPPAQIPELASVGIALTPYAAGLGYASTAPRRRLLWLELAQPIANKAGDALFARVVGHGADPLLYDATPDATESEEPPLTLDPELMRVIVPADSDDRAGLDAMIQLERSTDSPLHFLLPLPPGIDADDPELFGFYTYELRVGHAGDPHDRRWWSTAQGRFGRPLRVNGLQHPAPPLPCSAGRVRPGASTLATAPYATPVLGNRALAGPSDAPKTTLCFLLYAQVVQADADANRNVLLLHRYGTFEEPPPLDVKKNRLTQRDRIGRALFADKEIIAALDALGLPHDLPLSVVAVELLPGGTGNDLPKRPGAAPGAAVGNRDPLGADLSGHPQRILRVSPLVPVAAVC